MKVLMLNGSAKAKGNTYFALEEIGRQLEKEGVEYEIVHVKDPVRDCIGCGRCSKEGCVFGAEDGVNGFIAKAREADGFIFASPVYYAHPSGRVLSFLDRVFYAGGGAFAFKPAAAVTVARSGMPAVRLPSTSPANAACGMEKLVQAYAQVFEHLRGQ